MANSQNLIPINKRPKREQKKYLKREGEPRELQEKEKQNYEGY